MCELEHGYGMVAARWQLVNAENENKNLWFKAHHKLWQTVKLKLFSKPSVTLLLYLFLNVSLKRWKLENFRPTCEVAVLHFLSLTFYRSTPCASSWTSPWRDESLRTSDPLVRLLFCASSHWLFNRTSCFGFVYCSKVYLSEFCFDI